MPKPPPKPLTFAAYPTKPRPAASLWIMVVPVISTGHIPRSDAAKLEQLNVNHPLLMPTSANAGYLLNIADWTHDDRFSRELNHICDCLAGLGYHYARFDSAGDKFADLPTFEW